MRSEIILLCFLWVILKSSSSQSVPDNFFRYIESFDFFPTESSPSEEDQHFGYVVGYNDSSITLVIKLYNYTKNKLVGTLVCYQPLYEVYAPPTLEYNRSAKSYVAKEIHALNGSGHVGHHTYRQSASPSLEERIVITHLFPNTRYELDIKSYRENDTWRKAYIIFRTNSVAPNPPKIGTGCFRVYNISADGTRRNVKIYWQPNVQNPTRYEVFCYENGPKRKHVLVFKMMGFTSQGFLRTDISLNRHTFIFRSLGDLYVGYSTFNSTIEIPAQKDIEPPLRTIVYSEEQKNTFLLPWEVPPKMKIKNYSSKDKIYTFLLTWAVPQKTNITNYTVAWYDTLDSEGGLTYVRDFVHLSRSKQAFKIKANQWMGLAMSVNTEKGSSGLQPASYDEQGFWPVDE